MARDRELTVRILGDSSSAERAFKRTEDASKRIGPSGQVATKALENVSSSLTSRLGPAAGVADDALLKMGNSAIASGSALSLGLAGGAAVAGGALAALAADGVSQLLDLTGEIRNFQRASGASAEESSRFVAVLDDLQISSEAGGVALFKLGREVSAGAPKLRQYGIDVAHNADGTANLTETLLNVADAYAKAPDQATRSAIAFAAFGKSAQNLLPLLEKGREGLAEFFEGAESGHQIFSQDDLDQARELELSIDDLQDAIRGVQLVGAQALVPLLTAVADVGTKTVEAIEKIGAGLDFVNDKTGGLLGKIASSTVRMATPLGQVVSAVSSLGGESDKASGSVDDLAGSTEDADAATAGLAESQARAADALRASEKAAKDHAGALRDVFDASEDVIGAGFGVENAEVRLLDAHDAVAEAERALAEARAGQGAGAERAADAARDLADAQRDAARAAADAAENVAEAQADVDKAVNGTVSGDSRAAAAKRLADAKRAQAEGAENAAERIADAERAVAEAQGEGRNTDIIKAQRDLDRARRDETKAVIDLAGARRNLAVEQAAQAGQALTDAEKYAVYRDQLIALKDATPIASALRAELEKLIGVVVPVGAAEAAVDRAAKSAFFDSGAASQLRPGAGAQPAAAGNQTAGGVTIYQTINGAGLSPAAVAEAANRQVGWVLARYVRR